MKYVNTKTGAETNQFSDADWKSNQPQKAGWIKTGGEGKMLPKAIIDAVFTKVKERRPPEEPKIIGDIIEIPTGKVIEPVIGETKADFEPLPEIKQETIATEKVSKPTQKKRAKRTKK